MAFAGAEFRLDQPDKDGITLRAALIARRDRTSRADRRARIEAELAVPPCPDALRHVWDIHRRLRRRKGGNGFGHVPLELTDFAAFEQLHDVRLSPFEWTLIEMIDDLFVATRNNPARDGEQSLNSKDNF